jgi:hypothetical protein
MNRVLTGAVILSLAGATAATAQPYDQGRQSRYDSQRQQDYRDNQHHQSYRDYRDQRSSGRNYWSGRRHYSQPVCYWRHHHRVCYHDRRW